ncbi:hypothetical protein [Cryptosporangium arvum]|uniref:Nitroreductase family protein n=1 Tax=Cryptosporangium arvum DSM 44712 TaxID=927661 RepID=A0A010YVR4_9ACTN|nr:hypothetical protein [Cryptosporangium arvum]EXG79223.1 hypothetical protein CryarDRAFT_0252 [Cryptosporangium arvum DSM 44712]
MNQRRTRFSVAPASEPVTDAAVDTGLRLAVEAAGRAPSMFSTRPLHWRLVSHQLELRVDRDRALTAGDPHGRVLTLECGIALDHALVALAASGYWASVERLPADDVSGLMARILPTGTYEPTASDARLLRAITERRAHQRRVSHTPVPNGTIDRLRRLAEGWGVYLTEVHAESLVEFHVLAARVDEPGQSRRDYPAEAAASAHRLIPLRALCPENRDFLLPGPGHDGSARYLVLWSPRDDSASWLAAGEVTSTILLDGSVAELEVSPMGDVVETPISRTLVHSLLGNRGYAHAVLRIGMRVAEQPTLDLGRC